MNIEVYKYWGEVLSEAIAKAYAKGIKSIPELNKKKILGIDKKKKFDDKNIFEVNWTDTDKELLRNFTVEAFTVAAINSYELQEKLKSLAIDLMNKGELGNKELWQDEAYNIILQYIPEDETVPPPNYLHSNLQTAINSAYHGSRYVRLQELQDVYTHYQYKTQADSAVRDEHAVLHNRIWRSNDPIWQEIYPPNGWNCRCYINPMTIEEVSTSGIEPEQIIDSQSRTEILNQAKVSKEFRRNSGEIKSIWGKWLQSKLTDKVYDEITERLRGYANQMPDPEEVEEKLKQTKIKLPFVKLTKESWEKAFPNNIAITPLGEFILKDNQYKKIVDDKKREYLFGAIKETLKEPDYIIVDKENGTLIIKSFIGSKDFKNSVVVIEYREGREMIVSMHEKRSATIKNKVKDGKLLIYSRFQRSSQHFSENLQFTRAGVSLNFADTNLNNNELKINSYGELWGELTPGKIYSSVLRKITYKIDGFEAEITKSGKRNTVKDSYNNIDKYRIGILIERI